MQKFPTILKLKPHFESRIWAGNYLNQLFAKQSQQKQIGEAWIISAYPEKSATITNLEQAQSLLNFYQDPAHSAFFANYNLEHPYPLLVKIIDAGQDLSVQIHPDDAYAKQFGALGKTECWYVLATKANNYVIHGHHAVSLAQFQSLVEQRRWDELLKKQPINAGDFIYVPAKKIHAIKGQTLIYELQQSSDITYRVYDYERLENGQKRPLHLKEVYDLIETPDVIWNQTAISNQPDYLVANEQFFLQKITNQGQQTHFYPEAKWLQLTLINGQAQIENLNAQPYDSFLIAHQSRFTIQGDCECLVSYIK